jgi:hypothetical protein
MPPLQFSYFDPASETYKSIKTDSIQLLVNSSGVAGTPSGKTKKGSGSGRTWAAVIAGGTLLLFGLVFAMRKKRKPVVQPVPTQKIQFSAELQAMQTAALSDQEVCFRISKLLTAAEREFPSITTDQRAVLRSILNDCQLMVYSSITEEKMREAVKRRAITLLKALEAS